jgi:membrane-associated phospholipid phosphatase
MLQKTFALRVLLLYFCAMPAAAQSPAPDSMAQAPDAPSAVTVITDPLTIAKAQTSPVNQVANEVANQAVAATSGRWNVAGGSSSAPSLMVPLSGRLAGDQMAIWHSPLHLQRTDAIWALPSLAVTGAFVASDSWLSKQVPASGIERSRNISTYGTFSLAGAAGGMFLLGEITHNDHASETGFLAGEAAVNASLVDFAFKSMFQRQRPYQDTGAGHFFAGGSSFPSEHAAASWAIAGVVAHEYPGTFTKLLAYGLATVVSVTRMTGKEHFSSDVIVGSAMGYFIARQIYRNRRDPEVSEAAWGSPVERTRTDDKLRNPENMGSSYVPLDSWVYPLFERLAATGLIHTAYLGMRPWTRMQCARLLEEANESLRYSAGDSSEELASRDSGSNQASKMIAELDVEFADERQRLDGAENAGVSLDSVYTRATNISGTPLTDGYHFAQTLIDDFGRPYGQGVSGISGITGHAEAGPLSFSFQGEYQHAPAIPSYSPSVQQAIAEADFTTPISNGTGTLDRFRLLNSSVAFTFKDVQFSFGRQSEWWGPGESGPLLASDNAQPITMFQVQNVVPFKIPLLSRLLGPAQSVFFVGQLSGQTFVFNDPNLLGPGFHPQPFIHGNKVSFKPTPNLEIGMGVTAIFGGPGLPFTWSEFFRSYYSHRASTQLNPAKRFSGFDISYRVPGLRKWLTVYNDSLVGDEISPIGSSRPLLNPGLYMPQVPKLPKLELRFEGVKDPFTNDFPPGFVYFDRRYVSGYTNAGNLIGSWVGRDGFGAQAWATYWFSPRTKVQCGYRYQQVDRSFLEGGRLTDYSAKADTTLRREFQISAFVQYEQWMFPLLAATRQTNVTASLQFIVYPHRRNQN